MAADSVLKADGKSYHEVHRELGDAEPRLHESAPFRRGYERGREYLEPSGNKQVECPA
jgi:hypothetical protein